MSRADFIKRIKAETNTIIEITKQEIEESNKLSKEAKKSVEKSRKIINER